MKKLFFLAALAALSLGFSACSDDDESDDKGMVKQAYYLQFWNDDDSTGTELEAVKQAYYQAIGTTVSGEDDTFVMTAASAEECTQQFQAAMQQAEQALSSTTLTTLTRVYGYTAERDSIYGKFYGEGDNWFWQGTSVKNALSVCYYTPISNFNYSLYFPDYYVKELNVDESSWISDDPNTIYWMLPKLGNMRMISYTAKEAQSSSVSDVVAVKIYYNVTSIPKSIKINGHTYKVAKDKEKSKIKAIDRGGVDWNYYLYYTTESVADMYGHNRALKAYPSYLCYRYKPKFFGSSSTYYAAQPSDFAIEISSLNAVHNVSMEFVRGLVYDGSKSYTSDQFFDMVNLDFSHSQPIYLLLPWRTVE